MRMLVVATLVFLMSESVPGLAARGDNGGPYRNQAGRCVGWEALARQCGNPPSTKCTPENVAEGSGDAAVKGESNQARAANRGGLKSSGLARRLGQRSPCVR